MSGSEDFFDTNVLLYLLSADAAKADRAEELLAIGGTISVQVLNEFADVASQQAAHVVDRNPRSPGPDSRGLRGRSDDCRDT